MAPDSSTLAWKIPWTEEPVGHDWVTSLSLSCIGEGNGNPLQCSCLENPRDGGAWWAAVYGVAQSQTQLKWLSSSSSNILLSMVVQQRVVILEFSQEKMSARPSTASCRPKHFPNAPPLNTTLGIRISIYDFWGTKTFSLSHHTQTYSAYNTPTVPQGCPWTPSFLSSDPFLSASWVLGSCKPGREGVRGAPFPLSPCALYVALP